MLQGMIAPWACSANAGAGYCAHPEGQRRDAGGTQGLYGNKPRRKGPEMTSAPGPEIRLNGVRYRWPDRPVVVVCNDGGDPAYFDRALKDGIVHNVARFMQRGFCAIAQCVIASFHFPENVP